jgi:acyl dehydratase
MARAGRSVNVGRSRRSPRFLDPPELDHPVEVTAPDPGRLDTIRHASASLTRMSTPVERYFEDFAAGETRDLGSVQLSAAEIIAFAEQFDPQAFHVDPVRAEASVFGGLVASGWHTVGAYMRLFVEGVLSRVPSFGSPGVEQVRWPRPVRPGDALRARFTVLEARPSRSRPDRGIVRSRGEMFNQDGELVLSLEATNFIGRRP